jgi:hypothetical protein
MIRRGVVGVASAQISSRSQLQVIIVMSITKLSMLKIRFTSTVLIIVSLIALHSPHDAFEETCLQPEF